MKRWEAAVRHGPCEMHARGRLATEADPDTLALALLAALQGGLLLTRIERDTKPLQAAPEAMLDLIATHSGTTQR
jgi:TetR/AcrR family transcriptional regulator, transcriptional repressor for nem operon